jgi:hypothetical protein
MLQGNAAAVAVPAVPAVPAVLAAHTSILIALCGKTEVQVVLNIMIVVIRAAT